MAYLNNTEDENENSQGMNNTEAPSQEAKPAPVSSGIGGTASSVPAKTSTPQTPKPASSGNTPSFQNYMKANQGKAQESLNSAAAQNVANQGQAAKSSINQATTQFNQRADQGALGGEQSRSTAYSDAQGTVDAARAVTAGNQVEQPQQDRFKQVINAQYTGPESLRQVELYDPAAKAAQTAQNAINNTKTATGREELLRQMYQGQGNYTSGLNKLDSALLNASQQGVKNLQQAAQDQGNIGQQLDSAQIGSANTAQNRAKEVNDIRNQAREYFTTGKSAEEAATESRIDNVVNNWDMLPQYLRDTLKGSLGTANDEVYNSFVNSDQFKNTQSSIADLQNRMKGINLGAAGGEAKWEQLNSELQQKNNTLRQLQNQAESLKNQNMISQGEADFLGVQSGQGLYNLGADAIKTAQVAGRDEIVSKDEAARLQALSQLAGLDLSNMLSTNNLYENTEKAGTKTLADAYDKEATLRQLGELEQGFLANADKNYNGLNYKNLLQQSGYNTQSPEGNQNVSTGQILDQVPRGGGSFPNSDIVGRLFQTQNQNSLRDFLGENNFENRINVQNSDQLDQRTKALEDFIKSLETYNK